MVFENYALYPHLTVYDNIASPMRSPLYRKDEGDIDREVKRVAEMMGIVPLLQRLPGKLSNGQRQRTALGRCLVRNPTVFLMDEPLAHLDAKLRHLMRTELKAMQQQFDTTTIYVTHDYAEAMSLGDRVAIVNEGKIVQVGTGDEIYYTPCNEFVARLVGEPEINIVDADLVDEGGGTRLFLRTSGDLKGYELPADVLAVLKREVKGKTVRMGVRGINLSYCFEKREGYIPGSVYNLEPIGNKSILTIKANGQTFQSIAPNTLSVELDSPAFLRPDPANMLFFAADDGRFLCRHNQANLIGRD